MANDDSSPDMAVVVVDPDAKALVKTEESQDNVVQQETKALIEAIKRRAQAEIQTAGDITRETYLNAVRQTREAVEQNKLIDPDRIEQAAQHIQQEAEKNWNLVLNEMESFGTRLSDAAKAAWEALTGNKG